MQYLNWIADHETFVLLMTGMFCLTYVITKIACRQKSLFEPN